MALYEYKARDRDGLAITGELEVESEEQLADRLEKMDYILIEAHEKREPGSEDLLFKYRKVKSKQLVEFSVELSTLINAGIPLMSALDAMEEQASEKLFKGIIHQVRRDVMGGDSFSQALSKHPKAFNTLYVSMVRAGEATGELDKILVSLAKFLETSENNKAKVKAALIYPAVMSIVAVAVVIFLITMVLPNFVNIFKSAGVELPLPTKIVLGVSKIITTYWYVIIGGICIAVYTIKEYIKTEKGRYYFDMFKFKVPVFGKLIKKATISRFTRTFGTLMESSVPILTALDIVKGSVGNSAMAIIIDNIRNSVRQGGRVYEQIELSGMFPKMVSKMVNVGENSGSLDKMLMKVSDFYDNEVETEIKGLTSVIEPLMIVVMGIIIGVIVLSVMLPMFDMMKIARR